MLSTSGGTLSPWGPISAVLYELGNSENVQRIVQRAGLVVDWGLSSEQLFSNSTRIREYSNRISRAYILHPRNLYVIQLLSLSITEELLEVEQQVEGFFWQTLFLMKPRDQWNFLIGLDSQGESSEILYTEDRSLIGVAGMIMSSMIDKLAL